MDIKIEYIEGIIRATAKDQDNTVSYDVDLGIAIAATYKDNPSDKPFEHENLINGVVYASQKATRIAIDMLNKECNALYRFGESSTESHGTAFDRVKD